MKNLIWGFLFTVGLLSKASADEGMWLYEDPPTKLLKEAYGFEPDQKWFDHLRMSSVRLSDGGSGSFVSSNGLVLTNHHVASSALQRISTAEHDYLSTGLYAKTLNEEIPVPGLELDVLISIIDVTRRVNSAVTADMNANQAALARRAEINKIEKEAATETGFKPQVVTLYGGGAYHLYQYKNYKEVKLVFAPEKDIAFFGGDPDNFEFYRYDLDMALFRAYESGKPAQIKHYLKWASQGAKEGDLVFVSGHPGKTDRLLTVDATVNHLQLRVPYMVQLLSSREAALKKFMSLDAESHRRGEEDFFSVQNSLKVYRGRADGLQKPEFLKRKTEEEIKLKRAVANNPDFLAAWENISKSEKYVTKNFKRYSLLERGHAFYSHLFSLARNIVRLVEEREKPNGERLREYSEAGLPSLMLQLYSDEPIYADFEIATLTQSLIWLADQLGRDDPTVKSILGDKAPAERATELVNGSKLFDVEYRRKLVDGGRDAIENSTDSMILVAKLIDAQARALRKGWEAEVDEVQRVNYAKISAATLAAGGPGRYPDATFTLRFSYGVIRGYNQEGLDLKPFTTIGGAFEHSLANGGLEPFRLPDSWHQAKAQLNLETPLNFVSTNDIIGGNSGSPVVDRSGRLVGLIFDGNRYSFIGNYGFTEPRDRAISVDTRGMIEALKKIYKTESLLKEMEIE